MIISRVDKEVLIKSKNAYIEKLKYKKSLLIDQKQSTTLIKKVDLEILDARKELQEIQRLPEKPTGDETTLNITINGGNIAQVNTGTNTGPISQNNYDTGKQLNQIDFEKLEKELSTLHIKMKKIAKTDEHDLAISEIVKAKKSAKEKNKAKILENLKSAGKWALNIATEIGTPLAAEALKIALSLK